MEDRSLTTGQFLNLLYEKVLSRYDYRQNELFVRGRREGWLTELDGLSEHEPLSRRAAAGILHELLRRVIGEAEEEDWSAAEELADLYDCHHCVQHIAQVYVKGIMTATASREALRFGGEEFLLPDDAALAAERLLQQEKRVRPGNAALRKQGEKAGKISRAEAERFFRGQEQVLAVDVGRDTEELELPHKIQLPMMKLLENPFLLDAYRDHILLLYCNGGYQSELAANCLLEHGYPRVFYFGLEESNL